MFSLGMSQRPLTLILPQKYRDTNGRRIVIQIGGVYTTFCHREGIHLQKYAIETGGVSRYFLKISGSGVGVTLLKFSSGHSTTASCKICWSPKSKLRYGQNLLQTNLLQTQLSGNEPLSGRHRSIASLVFLHCGTVGAHR